MLLFSGNTPRQDEWSFCFGKEFCGSPDNPGGGFLRGSRPESGGIGHRNLPLQFTLLKGGIETDVYRSGRLCTTQLFGAKQGLQSGGHGCGLVIPLGIVTDQSALVLRGVYPVDPWTAFSGIDRPSGA